MFLFLYADFFSKLAFLKHSFNTIRVLNSLDPDQDRQNIGPDLGPNCYQGYQQAREVAASKKLIVGYHISPIQFDK